jgi:hypothetical protein
MTGWVVTKIRNRKGVLLINCPKCGYPVPDNQRFCGNCGTDVSAAASATPTPPAGAPISEGQPAPYAYAQPGGYGYEAQPLAETRPPVAGRMIIVLVVLLLAACCALMCGILIGFELSPLLFPSSTPAPRVTPTREGMLPLLYALGLA